jgi:hypothetical protein
MPTNYKILGQQHPTAANLTSLYKPTGVQAVLSTITVCNRASSSDTYRIAVIAATDGTLGNQSYLVYNATIPANTTTSYTLGITLGAGDEIKVYSTGGDITFHAYGSEIS